jgi:autotransporter-associated beta strand protein
MAGTGKLTLTNAQTYTGDTWISSGTLALNGVGSISTSSNLVVAGGATLDASGRADGTLKLVAGQTLSGFGNVLGKVVVTSGATISPGGNNNDFGTLTLNSTLNLTGGRAWMAVDKTGGTAANDYLTGITTLTYGGTLVVTNVTSDATPLAAGDSFKLFNATAYTESFTNYNLPPLAANLLWNTSQLATSGTLSVITLTTPVLSGTVTIGGGGMQLSFSGNNGQTYKVLGTTNLTLPMASWQVLTNGTFGAGPASFIDTANIQPVRFYRIVSP